MNNKTMIVGSLAITAMLLLSACGIARPSVSSQPPPAPDDGYGSGMMNGGSGGMMGTGHMAGMMSNGGMMGNYVPSTPTAGPTPIGATPVQMEAEIQIAVLNSRFAPAQITLRAGEAVRFVVTNGDPYLHNFVSEQAGIPFLNLPGNTTQTVTWTAPGQTDTYTAVCTLHPGMSLSIVIKD